MNKNLMDFKGKIKKIKASSIEDMGSKINKFIQYNAYILTAGIVLSFLFLNFRISSLASLTEDTLVSNTKYIKENIGHPIFLTASGVVITPEKKVLGYYDQRFKQYIINNTANTFIMGLIKFSKNYEIKYSTLNDIYTKNPYIKEFSSNFKVDHGALKEYATAIYRIMLEGRLPEYIDIIDTDMTEFSIDSKPNEDKNIYRTMRGVISVRALSKSWIKELGKWDNREINPKLKFEAIIYPSKYANIGNPFGIKFTKIDSPINVKATAREAGNGRR